MVSIIVVLLVWVALPSSFLDLEIVCRPNNLVIFLLYYSVCHCEVVCKYLHSIIWIQFQNKYNACNHWDSGHYTLFCLLFKTQCFGDWNLSPSWRGTYTVRLSSTQLVPVSCSESDQGLALSNGLNRLCCTSIRRQNPVSKMLNLD
jgi:hypothetical protein